ncbi:hypothetical protein F4779DRAFT_644156 [Xylariaceae sp. FL0662B]|nr:hypothetical protein F4779DRAFT_644156 [Xylariaceae sp. FL0662B]
MAEVLGIIGGISAIVHLTEDFIKLTRELSDYLENIRSAPKEVEYFLHETSIFSALLYYFQEAAGDAAEKLDVKLKEKRTKLVRMIERQCKLVKGGFADLVKRFKQVNGTDISPIDAFWARIVWLMRKPDIVGLRLSLESAKANVSLLSNLFILEALMKKNKKDKRIEVLREQLRNAVQTARQLRKELAEHQRQQKQHNMPEAVQDTSYEAITTDTREIEKYVVNTIRSQKQRETRLYKTRSRSSREQPPDSAEWETRLHSPFTRPGTAISQRDGSGLVRRVRDPSFDQTVKKTVNHPDAPNVRTETVLSDIESYTSIVNGRSNIRHLPGKGQLHSETYGDRVRDHGNGVYVDRGEWPTQIHGSDADFTDAADRTGIDRRDARGQKTTLVPESGERTESDHSSGYARPSGTTHGDRAKPRSAVEEHEGSLGGRGSSRSRRIDPQDSQVSHESSDEGDGSPYRPVPPFGGLGGRRRPRRRRPRSQSPVE